MNSTPTWITNLAFYETLWEQLLWPATHSLGYLPGTRIAIPLRHSTWVGANWPLPSNRCDLNEVFLIQHFASPSRERLIYIVEIRIRIMRSSAPERHKHRSLDNCNKTSIKDRFAKKWCSPKNLNIMWIIYMNFKFSSTRIYSSHWLMLLWVQQFLGKLVFSFKKEYNNK